MYKDKVRSANNLRKYDAEPDSFQLQKDILSMKKRRISDKLRKYMQES